MIGKTYSKRPSTATSKVLEAPPKKMAVCDMEPDTTTCHVKDVDELVGMGAVSMLADDIHFAVDSVDPRHNAPLNKILRNMRCIRESIVKSGEYGRQFRAHHGLDRVFEWWGRDGHQCLDQGIRGELVWLFCHLGAKVRRVDHFVHLKWIFETALLFLSGEGDSVCSLEDINTCEPFQNQPITYQTVAQYMIGKACLCKTAESATTISQGLSAILVHLDKRDQQTVTLLDFAVALNVEGSHDHAASLLAEPPFKTYELKALVSLSGSPKGWLLCTKNQIDHIIKTIQSNANDCEWCIYGLSVLINCVDRDDHSEQYDWVVERNQESLLEMQQVVPDEAKPYASLLLAFAIMNKDPNNHSLPATTLQAIRAAIHIFITIPDMRSAQAVKQLADRLKQNGWLPEEPPK